VVLSNLAGDTCLRFGLRQTGSLLFQPPNAYLQAILTPWVGVASTFYCVWMFAQMVLFSYADLSYVVPITSIGYALAALAGRLFLREFVSPMRWLGVSLIAFGVVLVSSTQARTLIGQKR
jgi:drug/metabolite transporter (DMT)-like permease